MNPTLPKQARAMRTRQRIIDAATALLRDEGLSGVRTAAVARQAGVSEGALFRHFRTKPQLLGATLASVLASLYDRFAVSLAERASSDGDVVRLGVDALWEVYTDPALYGGFEVFLAARTDPDLRAITGPVLRAHIEREIQLARTLFPDAARDNPRFDATIVGLLATLQGLAVGAAAWSLPVPQGSSNRAVELEFVEAFIRRELGEPNLSLLRGDA